MILRPPPSPAYVAYVASVEGEPAYSAALLLGDVYAAGAGCEKLGAFCRVLGIFSYKLIPTNFDWPVYCNTRMLPYTIDNIKILSLCFC